MPTASFENNNSNDADNDRIVACKHDTPPTQHFTACRKAYGGILVGQLSIPGLERRDRPKVGFAGRGRGGLFA